MEIRNVHFINNTPHAITSTGECISFSNIEGNPSVGKSIVEVNGSYKVVGEAADCAV